MKKTLWGMSVVMTGVSALVLVCSCHTKSSQKNDEAMVVDSIGTADVKDSAVSADVAKMNPTESVSEEVEVTEENEDLSTAGMIKSLERQKKELSDSVAAETRRVLYLDSSWRQEVKAWGEMYLLIDRFCVNLAIIQWFGGSGVGPAALSVSCGVLKVRIDDLRNMRLWLKKQDSAYGELDKAKKQFVKLAEAACKSIDSPAKAREYIVKEDQEEYDMRWQRIQDTKVALFKAVDRWVAVRRQYPSCTARTLTNLSELFADSQ